MVLKDIAPERLGPYLLLETIGSGGMGVVRLARDRDGRAFAVKLLHPEIAADPDARRRLSREVALMRRIRSQFIAGIIDADVTGDIPYVVTRYVPGMSLDQVVARHGPLRGAALERLAFGLAEGLAAVHAAGVVHRDLKPGNVMIAGGVPVLIDFGIAHAPDASRITRTGMLLGTPGYLAPELVRGQPGSPAADVHAWAGTVAYAGTGRPPFGTGSYETIFYRLLNGQPDLTGLPEPLLPLLTAAFARDPAARPSAAELSARCAAVDLAAPGDAASQTRADGVPVAPGQPDQLGGLLPGVRYESSVRPAGQERARPARLGAPGWLRGTFGVAVMAAAVSASVLLPVAGTAVSLLLIVVLRAADGAQVRLFRRRSARGRRVTDLPVMVITAPWALVRALLGMLWLAPLPVTCAAAAGGAALLAAGGLHHLATAGGWAAGAAVACYGFGPRSAIARGQLGRLLGGAARGRAAAAVIVVAAVLLAAVVAVAAATQPHLLWPLHAGGGSFSLGKLTSRLLSPPEKMRAD